MEPRIPFEGKLDMRRKRPLSKRELAAIAGVSVSTLNKENRLGRLGWTRDFSSPRAPGQIAMAEAHAWLESRRSAK